MQHCLDLKKIEIHCSEKMVIGTSFYKMNAIKIYEDKIILELSKDELGVLSNALNEVCNGIESWFCHYILTIFEVSLFITSLLTKIQLYFFLITRGDEGMSKCNKQSICRMN